MHAGHETELYVGKNEHTRSLLEKQGAFRVLNRSTACGHC